MYARVVRSTMRWSLFALLAALFWLSTSTRAQRPSDGAERRISPQAPFQAELLAPLDAGKLSRGATVLAKARFDWNDPNCHLRAGSVVVGHIVDLQQRSKLNKGSSVAIAFDQASCDGHISPFNFTLFAIIAKPQIDEGIPLADTAARFGAASSNPHFGMGGRSTAPAPAPVNNKDDMSLRGQSNDKTPSVIMPGQIIGLKKFTLSVGTGPDGASVVSALKDNIRLEGATQLILMPRAAIVPDPTPTLTAKSEPPPTPTAPAIPTSAPVATPTPASPPEPVPEIDETEICSSSCNTVPTAADPALATASLTLSTARLGSIPHNNREYAAFDFDSTLTYLDAQNLLFTYDPHKLRQRFPSGNRTESMRTIRAVLLDPKTLSVKRVLDWQVQGEGQYIWHAGPGQVLVHLGHHLRLLGPNLAVIREIAVPGQLVFGSVSPSGDHIALGTLHERYSREMYDLLTAALHVEPEEDVDIQLLDSNFAVLLTTRQSSYLPAPILSDAGEIRINSAGHNRWRISEYLWDHTDRTIATTISECRPNLATPLPQSVFLVGCSSSPLRNWYRMIRLDGHPILQGHGSSQEIEQSSSSSSQSDFAVRVVRTLHSKSRGDVFRKSDLQEEEISVYRATDGKRLFLTANPGVSLAEQSFALSPTGHQLAVLSDATISLYSIGTSSQ
jgi:hypothetical protein